MSLPSSMPVPLLALDEVTFAYRRRGRPDRRVLHGISLSVAPGELVFLLGPNGSGKTTLLRVAQGMLPAGHGAVVVEGRPVGDWTRRELAQRMALLPQLATLPDGFRVEELVEMGRSPHARSRFGASDQDATAVERALVDADALDLVGRPIDELSGGERQRVLVAMALAQEPRLLLLDEPTQHLDLAHQVSLLTTLDRLRRTRNLAVLAVLHDPALTALADPRVVLLSEGRIVADGPAADVLEPATIARVFGVPLPTVLALSGGRGARP
ncbi:MAG TPA: ABC transporter ATP-binding protein [Candidatus Limnocylindria bacterium]|nr:ABC transporter ATP-binding protein [Candidatus Limnocylindria bacterium]